MQKGGLAAGQGTQLCTVLKQVLHLQQKHMAQEGQQDHSLRNETVLEAEIEYCPKLRQVSHEYGFKQFFESESQFSEKSSLSNLPANEKYIYIYFMRFVLTIANISSEHDGFCLFGWFGLGLTYMGFPKQSFVLSYLKEKNEKL